MALSLLYQTGRLKFRVLLGRGNAAAITIAAGRPLRFTVQHEGCLDWLASAVGLIRPLPNRCHRAIWPVQQEVPSKSVSPGCHALACGRNTPRHHGVK
jgi:hypothetical protein